MNKQCYGWKVLLQSDRSSVSNKNGDNPYSVIYPVNKEVLPKIGKLFFFRYEKDAGKFMGVRSTYIVVRCIATNAKKGRVMSLSWQNVSDFWNNKVFLNGRTSPHCNTPEGTYFADSITCLE